jgi:hypothetical protein
MTMEHDKFFDDNKTYKFRHLQNAGVVRNRVDLEGKKKFGFPPGRLFTPRDRQWTGRELNDYLNSRPTTQQEFDALVDRPAKSKPNIPPKKKPHPTVGEPLNTDSRVSSARRRGGRVTHT